MTALFRREHCKYEMGALVQGQGLAANATFQGDKSDARRAYEAALDHVADTLLFVPCPNCKKVSTTRGPELKRKLLLKVVGLPLAIGLGLATWVLSQVPREDWSAAAPYLGGFPLFIVAPPYLIFPKPWVRALARTQFAKPH